jgi:hypothetical protein
MAERKKGSGYEDVKRYVLENIRNRECLEDPFVRIISDDIAAAIGISGQAVRKHLALLLQRGVFVRQGRFQYAQKRSEMAPIPFLQSSGKLQYGCDTVAIPLQNDFSTPDSATVASPPSCNTVAIELQNGCDTVAICSKKELQEKTNEKNKERCVDFLGDWVDVTDSGFLQVHAQAVKLFNRYGAGIRKGTSPALINRFCAGLTLGIPLITFQELEEQLKEAEQETALFDSFKGFGKQSGIRRPYIRIANYLKKCFEAAGWVWTACTSPFEFRLKKAHQYAKTTPTFPQLESTIKPQTGSAAQFSDRLDPSGTDHARLPSAVVQLAESFRIDGKKPPD